MGLTEFLVRHGPGSPGSVAKSMARAYRVLHRRDPTRSRDELMAATLASRGSVPPEAMPDVLASCRGDMARLVQAVIRIEDPAFMRRVERDPYAIRLMTDAIEHMLEKRLPPSVLRAQEVETENGYTDREGTAGKPPAPKSPAALSTVEEVGERTLCPHCLRPVGPEELIQDPTNEGWLWRYVQDGEEKGPVSRQLLAEEIRAGRLPPDVRVRSTEMVMWLPADQLAVFRGDGR